MLSILHTGGPEVLYWAELRHSVSQLFFSTHIHLEGFSPLSRAAHMKTVVIFLYCTSLLKQKVRGYLNTSTVYIKKGKGKYSSKNSHGTGFFIFAFPMINDAPRHTLKLTVKQGTSQIPLQTIQSSTLLYICSRILRYDKAIEKYLTSSQALRLHMLMPKVFRDVFI